jgi:hypothetical protein
MHYQNCETRLSFPSDGELRLEQRDEAAEPVAELQTVRTIYGKITGVPESVQPGDVLIVSTIVGDLWKEGRPPGVILLVPNTGKSCIRDQNGRIVAVTCFIRK